MQSRLRIDYRPLFDEIAGLPGATVLGQVGRRDEKYPLIRLEAGSGAKKALLFGAVHGDEPAGAYSVSHFMRNFSEACPDFSFEAYPCVNPWGMQHDKRGNAQFFYNPDPDIRDFERFNLNREFKAGTEAQEMQLILPLLEGPYVFAMDFHETWPNASRTSEGESEPKGADPDKFYFWENCPDHSKRIGTKILAAIKAEKLPICTWKKIYGDTNSGGVVWYPEGCGEKCYGSESGTSDAYLIRTGLTDHSFTIEVPRTWDLNGRVNAHMISLMTALENK